MVESMNISDAIIIPVVVYQISRDSQVAEPNLDSQSTKKSLPSLLVIIVERVELVNIYQEFHVDFLNSRSPHKLYD